MLLFMVLVESERCSEASGLPPGLLAIQCRQFRERKPYGILYSQIVPGSGAQH
jgi:hypothetical protein